MPIEITMPRLSDTMERGTVIKWNMHEGDEVAAGDVVADIETDKATMEMPVYDDGTIAKIIVQEGQTVEVGTLIAVLAGEDESADDVAAQFADAKARPGGTNNSNTQQAETNSGESADAASTGATAAASAEQPQHESAHQDELESAGKQPQMQESSGRGVSSSPQRAGDNGAATPQRGDGQIKASPVARRLAEEHQLDLRALQGSGPGGRIIKRDVLGAIEAGQETVAARALAGGEIESAPRRRDIEPTPVAQSSALAQPSATFGLQEQTIQLSGMRQTIARRLVESKTTIPHYQVTVTFDMDALLNLRRDLNESLAEQGVKLSVNDFLVRACALAMYEHPYFNASWEKEQIRIHGRVNVGIAVSLPEERGGGLVVASIDDADRKTLREISYESKMLAEKARTRGLSQDELTGSTFTLSNLGMFGVDNFTAIINPPNSAILAVGAAIQKPVVRNGELTVGHEMAGTLSCDHRVIDGAMAARYLQTLKQLIEHPAMLMV